MGDTPEKPLSEKRAQEKSEKEQVVSTEQMKQVFRKYVSDRKIVIADEAASSRAGLAKTLVELGAKTININMAGNLQVAEEEIARVKPHVVLCDYDIGRGLGLTLLQKQRQSQPETKSSLFILVTGNTSQAAVAQAAEEDVDTYIIKPYTLEILRRQMMKAAMAKIKPDPYFQTIDKGKELLLNGQIEEAMATFNAAMPLNPKPSLACFYLGQANLMKEALDQSHNHYNSGLNYNKIHYKCLVGLFELLQRRNQYIEAYDVVKRISQYFPANPQRLSSVLRLAIVTKNYDDIEGFYQTFTNMDTRSEEMIRYVCAALVVCGKYYLQKRFNTRAYSLFQKAAATGTGRTKILREIVVNLTSEKLANEAKEYLARFPAESRQSPDFIISEYLVLDLQYSDLKSIDEGRKLIQAGIQDAIIFKTMIRRAATGNRLEALEHSLIQAKKLFPDQAREFDGIAGIKP